MPRAVAPWTWRRALRDHGPDDRSILLTLYVVGTFMGRDGTCFPSQPTIAKGARVSERTVRRQLEQAQKLGWIGIETMNAGGHGWRKNVYRCAVPDDVEIDEKDEKVAGAIEAQEGEIAPLRQDTQMSARSIGADTQMSARHVGDAVKPSTSGHSAHERAANQGEGPVILNGTSGHACPINSRSNSLLNSQSELTGRREARAEAQAVSGEDSSRKTKEDLRREERERRVAVVRENPEMPEKVLASMVGRLIDEVRQVRAASRNGGTSESVQPVTSKSQGV